MPANWAPAGSAAIHVNKPRIRAALAAVLALAASPDGFTVADMTAKVHAMTGQAHATYNTRQAAYDLRKLRGKQLVPNPRAPAATICPVGRPTISACSPSGTTSSPRSWPALQTAGDHHVPTRLTPSTSYDEHLRTDMATLVRTWASSPARPRHSLRKPNFWRSWNLKRLGPGTGWLAREMPGYPAA